MKFSIILLIGFIHETLSREFVINSAEYEPKESDLIDYGDIKLLKNRQTREFVLKGNFTLHQNVGNEKTLVLEVYRGTLRLMRTQYMFCDYMNRDTVFWTGLVKNSNFPKDNPCPFPAVSSKIL